MHEKRRLGLPKRVPWLPTAALAFLVLMLSPSGWGLAVTATLLGTITDNTGAAVPGANVQVVKTATGITHTSISNESGNYTFPDLSPGGYATQAGIPGVNISQFTSGQVGIIMGDFSSNPLIGYSASLPWIRGETNIDIVNH